MSTSQRNKMSPTKNKCPGVQPTVAQVPLPWGQLSLCQGGVHLPFGIGTIGWLILLLCLLNTCTCSINTSAPQLQAGFSRAHKSARKRTLFFWWLGENKIDFFFSSLGVVAHKSTATRRHLRYMSIGSSKRAAPAEYLSGPGPIM